jgi:vacuolar-type H+-ATPase subunit D/Vma8
VKQKRNELIAEIFRCSLTKEDERAEILYEAASELIIGYTDMISDNYEARIKVYEERIQTDDQYIDMGIDMGEEYMKIYEEAIVDYARNTVYKLVDIAIEIAKIETLMKLFGGCMIMREQVQLGN